MASAMELNDINLLVLTGLVSLSLIGLSLSLTIWGFLFGLISPFVAERFWPWLLNTIGDFGKWGRRATKVLKVGSFLLVWIVGPMAAVWLGMQAVAWFGGLNKSPRLIEHGREAGEVLQFGEMTMRWIPMPEESESCWMLDSEVSQRLWRNVMGPHPGLKEGEDAYPVEVRNAWAVKWFLGRLNKMHAVFGWKWTIPNVDQWTKACNAGISQEWPYWQSRAWTKENSGGVAHPVREREPNAWGLYDMVGNAAEMCTDVGEMRGELLLSGLSYKTSWKVKRRRAPWVMDIYLYTEEDGWIFDESDVESGFRVCLVPTPYAYVRSGNVFWFNQDKQFRALCNYVVVYGFVGLLLQVFLWIFGSRIRAAKFMRWLLWLSVAEEFLRHSGLGRRGVWGFIRKWTMRFVAMLFKYSVGQILGYPISSLVASAVPSLPDLTLSPPDEWLMPGVIVVTFPMLLISLCVYKSVRNVRFSWAWLGRAYKYVLLPAIMLISYCSISDAWQQYCIHRKCDVNPYCVHPIHLPDPSDPGWGDDENEDEEADDDLL